MKASRLAKACEPTACRDRKIFAAVPYYIVMTYRSIYVFFTGMVTDIVIYHTVPYLSIYCLYPTPNDLVYIYIYARRTWSVWVWFWFAFDSKMPLLQSGQKGCPSGQKQKGTNKTPINFTLAPQDFQIFCERSGVFSGASWRKPSPSAEASPKHSTTPSDRETLNIRSHSHRPHHDLCAKNQ